jgi:hypothetical protein
MLCGEPGQGLGAEVRELAGRLFRLSQPFLKLRDLRLEAGDLGFPRVGDLSGLLQVLEAALEFCAEAGIGAGALEGGAVGSCFAGEGLDVAFAAVRDLAAKEPVHCGSDAVLVLGALGCGDSHSGSRAGAVSAASISATTRSARSQSFFRRVQAELLAQLRRRIKPLVRRRTKEQVASELLAEQEQVLEEGADQAVMRSVLLKSSRYSDTRDRVRPHTCTDRSPGPESPGLASRF